MENDYKLIVRQFDKSITIYPVGDVHLGSLEHNQEEWEKFVKKVLSEQNSYIILVGDLINNATRSSVSNVFDDVLRPAEQKEKMVQYLKPLAEKGRIICAVPGNHERRSGKDADNDPMYDIMCQLGIEELYRQNMAFVKLQLGKGGHATYTFAVTHGAGGGSSTGASVNKNERFASAIDNLDCLITGHTHKGALTKPEKLVIDTRTNTVSLKTTTVMTSQSWLSYGGYAMRFMYLPAANASADNGQKLLLNKTKKNIKAVW
jgi:predicted MPP superfamily phosphohydrolase